MSVEFGVGKIFAQPFFILIDPKLPVQPSDPSTNIDSVILAHPSVNPLTDSDTLAIMRYVSMEPKIS